MGRHGRSAAPAAEDHAPGTAARHRGGVRRKRRIGAPIRTGLLGASAAMAVGAVAVASGLLPGGGQYTVGAADGEQVRAEGIPPSPDQARVDPPAQPTDRITPSPSRASAPSRTPSPKASTPTPSKPAVKPPQVTKEPIAPAPPAQVTPGKAPAAKAPVPQQTTQRAVEIPSASNSFAAAVLTLVNQERAKVGCSSVRDDSSLDSLAQSFSDEMAARDFFDHTDPDGKTPWDRADAAGVEGLGGENIARGQADAQAVMDAWMNSEGHRANILNCDYTRLGVGVHTGPGGPWWTQDFGF